MSLIRKQTLINLCCAARLLDLDESTILQKKCGTENLSHIRRGNGKRQRVSLVLEEVIQLKTDWISEALKQNAPSAGKKNGAGSGNGSRMRLVA